MQLRIKSLVAFYFTTYRECGLQKYSLEGN